MFWSFSDKVDRFRKFTILQPNFRNKIVFNKIWCPQLIFFNEKKD